MAASYTARMRRWWLLVPFLLPSAAFAVETMRISMAEAPVPTVVLTGLELAFGEDAEDAAFVPAKGRTVEVARAGDRLLLDGVPWVGSGDSVRFRASGGTASLRAGGFEVRGDVVVRVQGNGLQLINVLPLEEYLAAVLGSEMPRTFPMEALKAQAVAARTYALAKKVESYGLPFHLGSSVLHQVYRGVAQEDERTRAAVEATRGEVLTFELAPIEAYFHASCGGRTESGADALSRDLPYLQPVDCPCGTLPASSWSLTLAPGELRSVVGPSEAEALSVLGRSPTGRARRVRLTASRTLDAAAFRARLGYSRVKSLAFEVDHARGGVRLVGRGFGHGAGLCQWGAKALADQGWDYRRILLHYYPGVELQPLY